ncbi:chromate resistance protein [Siccirubricoccus sp. G192]|nr:chromate resistance protein [Siccirubricoccus sp. G192]
MHGHAVSQEVAAALRARGLAASYLEGGIEGWASLGLPLAAKPGRPSVWVTRARPKVDRVACPWLLRRFVDPDARILFVPPAEVARVAGATGGTAFDIPGAPLYA